MARCEECLHFELCDAFEKHNRLMKVEPKLCSFYKPTLDTEPSSGAARAIFAEIESLEIKPIPEAMPVYVITKKRLEELKKKYL